MREYYKKKMEFHHEQWQVAFNTNKPKAANYHMQEYINYKYAYEQALDRAPASV